MKKRINLDNVALIGRVYSEYERIFRLSDFKNLNVSILDVGSGVSSFCAEARDMGMNVMGMDPIYNHDSDELKIKCTIDLELVIDELDGVEHLYIWKMFQNKEVLKEQRKKAYKTFIKHYESNKGKLYIADQMPKTRFKKNQFDIVISSHLLFLYDHIFNYTFHKNSIIEMLRIASKEIRLFPLVNLYGKKSLLLEQFLNDDDFKHHQKSIEQVDYEFIRGGNEFLRIRKNE